VGGDVVQSCVDVTNSKGLDDGVITKVDVAVTGHEVVQVQPQLSVAGVDVLLSRGQHLWAMVEND
jgi:hypothetical protein